MVMISYCKQFISFALTVFSVICLLSPAVLAEETVRIGGAGSGLGIIKILAEAFKKEHPGTSLRVLPNLGSAGGIKALIHGDIDLAISGRPLKKEESMAGAVSVECASSPFAFIVNKFVNKTDLTTRELEMIYNGQMSRWADGTRIRLILRPSSDTDTSIIKTASKNMEEAVKNAASRPDMIIAVTDQEAAEAVERIPGAIGAATLTQIETEKLSVKPLSFNSIKPTPAAISQARYPLTKPLFLVSSPKTPAAAHQFIKFVRSAKGRSILEKHAAMPSAADKGIK